MYKKTTIIIFILVTLLGVWFLYDNGKSKDVIVQEEGSQEISTIVSEENTADVLQNTNAAQAPYENQTLGVPEVSEDVDVYIIPIQEAGILLDAMNMYAKSSSGFVFEVREFSGLGAFVESINGKENRRGFYWSLYINNELSQQGVSSAEVFTGDVVEWRYQKGI